MLKEGPFKVPEFSQKQVVLRSILGTESEFKDGKALK